MQGQDSFVMIYPILDDSGYYFVAKDKTVSRTNICRYLFSSPSSASCQKIPNYNDYTTSTEKISDTQYFLLGADPLSPYSLHFFLFTFTSLAPTWAMKMSCPSGV